MNEILAELGKITEAISALKESQLDSVINLIALIPLPLITILFSLYSAWKQNEVSLFAQRYDTYLELCRLLRLRNRLNEVLAVDSETGAPKDISTNKVLGYVTRIMGYDGKDLPAEYLAKTDAILRQIRFLFSELSPQELEHITILRHSTYNFINKASSLAALCRDDESVQNFFAACDTAGTVIDEVYADQAFPRKTAPVETSGNTVVGKMELILNLNRKWPRLHFLRRSH